MAPTVTSSDGPPAGGSLARGRAQVWGSRAKERLPETEVPPGKRLLAYNPAARRFLYFAVAAGFTGAGLVIAQAWLLSGVVSRVFLEKEGLPEVRTSLFLLGALAFVRALTLWAADVLAQRSAGHLKGALRADLLSHLSRLGPEFSRGERSGELVNTAVVGVEDLDEYVAVYQPLAVLAVLVPVLVSLVIVAIDPVSPLVVVVTAPMLVVFLVLIGSRAKELTERRFLELGWMSAHFLDLLQGLATLKMFGRSREQVENIDRISRHYGSTTMAVLRTAFETAFVLELGTTIATALVAVEVSLRLIHGALSFHHALALLIITPEFFLPLRQLSFRYHAGAAGKAAAERIFTILDTPPLLPSTKHVLPRSPAAVGDIRLHRVCLSYENGDRPALRDVSFEIRAGEKVALIGETGAGKSTLASLLLRFIEADGGSIAVDGVPLSSLDPAAWRSRVAWVPQRPRLFFGTVAANIRLGRPEASGEEVEAAAAAAQADSFIRRLPNGYDTLIGEDGARLSGGEQQRLAIARALLKDSSFLVLDEPTSHLDSATEARFQQAFAILTRGRTVLLISHRLDLILGADQVVVLSEGRVIEHDNYDSVRSQDGVNNGLISRSEASGP